MKIPKRCKGCHRLVKVIKIHVETGKVEVSREYCDSEEMISARCTPYYPNLSKDEIMKKYKDKRLWKF